MGTEQARKAAASDPLAPGARSTGLLETFRGRVNQVRGLAATVGRKGKAGLVGVAGLLKRRATKARSRDEAQSAVRNSSRFHSAFLSRKKTLKRVRQDGRYGTLSYEKMIQHLDNTHPRILVDGEHRKLPACTDVGDLMDQKLGKEDKEYDFDALGVGVTIYFKLLKSFIIFLVISTILAIPLYYFYSRGNFASQSNSAAERILAKYSLGNLGESSVKCTKKDIR